MSSGQPAPDPPPLNATRQMLDDLDALMARMLALPINDAEEVAASPAAAVATAPAKSRPLAATLTLLQVPPGEPPLDPAHTATNPSHIPILGVLNAAATAELTASPPRAPKPASYPPLPALTRPAVPEPLSGRVVPPAPDPELDALLAEVADPPASLARWFILPLLWGNRLYDRGTAFFGESGAWLRGPAGRGVLGTTGLVLFAAAFLWLLRDWLGWTW